MDIEKVRAELAKMKACMASIEAMIGGEADEESSEESADMMGGEGADDGAPEKSTKKAALVTMLKKKSY